MLPPRAFVVEGAINRVPSASPPSISGVAAVSVKSPAVNKAVVVIALPVLIVPNPDAIDPADKAPTVVSTGPSVDVPSCE